MYKHILSWFTFVLKRNTCLIMNYKNKINKDFWLVLPNTEVWIKTMIDTVTFGPWHQKSNQFILESERTFAQSMTKKPSKRTRDINICPVGCVLRYCTWVVAALKEMPRREQRPRPAATDSVTSRTPASPTAPWDLAQSHRSMVRHA